MRQQQQQPKFTLQRNSTSSRSTREAFTTNKQISDHLLRQDSPFTLHQLTKTQFKISSFLRSFIKIFPFPPKSPTCRWLAVPSQLTPSLGRKVTGTLFGHRRGHVSFAVQDDSLSRPVLLLEFATSTANLVKEMSTGLVRIALDCEKTAEASGKHVRLFNEPVWMMYCNGRKSGYAVSRVCSELDWHVLNTVQNVSAGAGVIPAVDDGKSGGAFEEGELLYMRARFERVVGNRDSEALYMMNPDGNGGPELSIFFLRL